MRIAVGKISHETNSFSNVITTEAFFRRRGWQEGEELFTKNRGINSHIGGFLAEAENVEDCELVPVFGTFAAPSGLIEAATWETIRTKLIEGFKAAGPIDGILLDIHGAGVAETSYDIEGDLLSDLRDVFGRDLPIIATLDLHGNITQRMVDNADMMFGVMEYPHVDYYDRGREAMRAMAQQLKGELHPEMVIVRLPMIITPSTTLHGPALDVNNHCAKWEAVAGIVDCTFFHGFPYTDGPQVAVSVVAISDGNKELALAAAQDVADFIWSIRAQFNPTFPNPEVGLKQALANDAFPVVINETSDNPGAGGPGDGTHLLKAMLALNVPNTVLSHLADPEVVRIAHDAKEGDDIEIQLGGKTDDLHGEPLRVTARILQNTVCEFVCTGPMDTGRQMDLGRSTRLKIGEVDVIVTEEKSQMLSDDILRLHGIDMSSYKIVALKSSQHFRGFFEQVAAKIITVDSPGLSTFDLRSFSFASSIKFKYPLNELTPAKH